MSQVRKCSKDDVFYEGEKCPYCNKVQDKIVSSDIRKQLSKFLSGVLRHFPEDFDIDIDENGWADTKKVLSASKQKYDWVDLESVVAVVMTDDKGRYEIDGSKIRATYGHSIDINLGNSDDPIPDVLYHGTSRSNLSSIASYGLEPMSRQHVHLTDSEQDARNVGKRHGNDVIVLEIDVSSLLQDGYNVNKRGKNVYTCSENIPPEYVDKS